MKCVVNLYDSYENIEIVTEIEDRIIKKLNNFIEDESISSEDLIHLMVENVLQGECRL